MSFAIALSGLNAASADLSVTANNIANANTTGFKSSRAEFADIYTVSARGGGSAVGSGARLADVSQQFTQGSISFTNNSLDLAISGEGFFTLSDNGEMIYTRAGSFGTDREGFVVNQAGQRLQVFPALPGGGFNTATLSDLQLSVSDNPPSATSEMTVLANLPADATPPTNGTFSTTDPNSFNHTTSVTIYDSLGASHPATLYFVKTGTANTWDMHVSIDGTEVGTGSQLVYSSAGELTTPANGSITLPGYTPANGSDPINLTVSLGQSTQIGQSTQFGSIFGVNAITQNGYASGRLAGIEITEEGVAQARYTNGQSAPLGRIALANFPNPQGLQQLGDTNWGETFSSGAAQRGTAGSSVFGLVQSGALEASNVDLTAQLVNMITAQRNFQANAQMISTSDQITQTIINIR